MPISGTTKILGVIGYPVEHSFSPAMHNAAIEALGLDLCYVAFRVLPEHVGWAMDGMRGLGILGMNVTIPHKGAVIPFLDEISPEAQAVGAVNTIAHRDGRLIGYNSDVYGLLTALRQNGGLHSFPSRVVILGAGGAARAAMYAMTTDDEVHEVHLLNRTVERAEQIATAMEERGKRIVVGSLGDSNVVRQAIKNAGLLINVTSVGMHPNTTCSPIEDTSFLHPDIFVFDSVFNPLETLLVKQAKLVGAQALGGLDMLVHQGARAFTIWTGVEPPVEVMKQAIVGRFH
jgi:shikimate dehydrogenase